MGCSLYRDVEMLPIDPNVTDFKERVELLYRWYDMIEQITSKDSITAYHLVPFLLGSYQELRVKVERMENYNLLPHRFFQSLIVKNYTQNLINDHNDYEHLIQSQKRLSCSLCEPRPLNCDITKKWDGQPAPLLPYKSKDVVSLVHSAEKLGKLWGPAMEINFRNAACDVDLLASAHNQIYLAPELLPIWNMNQFGLKPIRNKEAIHAKEVWVQFHWFPKYQLHNHYEPSQLNRIQARRVLAQLHDVGDHPDDNGFMADQSAVYSIPKELKLKTGRLFKIKRAQCDGLPSLDLLEMRWHLARLAVMQGLGAQTAEPETYTKSETERDSASGDGAGSP
ncbi:hypothetical protein SEUCBS140593_004051 [Sporothrix eucalyptigena]|uniref:HNH nuclease domain-containing protein n=1 Tax=Sporothrix eucalyptigena TaxID=1812306 RepID=A0ABP0BJV0_9PEZI